MLGFGASWTRLIVVTGAAHAPVTNRTQFFRNCVGFNCNPVDLPCRVPDAGIALRGLAFQDAVVLS
jgi:hypothetical protein